MPRYSFVLLDADNTLFDFDKAEERSLRQVLTAYGLPADDGAVARYHRINAELWARQDAGEITRDYLVVERFAALLCAPGCSGDPQTLNQAYVEHLSQCADMLPGAVRFCRRLSPHCTLAIVTNGIASSQRRRFERSPLKGVIPYLFISEELGFHKPQREYFEAVCATLGIADRRQAVVVGDNLGSDILGGLNAGIDTIWFNPSHLPRRPEISPQFEVDSFDVLEQLLLP